MTLRKITVDNIVNYIAQSEQTKKGDNKPNTIKNNSLPRKQNKKISRKNEKKFAKTSKTSAKGFKKII